MRRQKSHHRAGLSLLKAAVLGSVLSMAAVMPLMADTDVEFSGTLVADPCQVDMDSADQTVEMWPVATSTFINNETSGPKDFSIQLYDCDLSMGSQVSVVFQGDKDSRDPDLFAISGTAEGVALTIFDSNGKRVLPYARQDSVPLSGTEVSLKWQARLQTVAGRNVTEGEYLAVVTFLLEYE